MQLPGESTLYTFVLLDTVIKGIFCNCADFFTSASG